MSARHAPRPAATRPATEVLPTAALKTPALPKGIGAVEVRRSARRRRTVSARVEADRIVVLMPAHLSISEEQDWVNRMVDRLSVRRAHSGRTDADLARRATQVARRHLDAAAGRELRPTSVRWVTTMNKRWASCSTDSGAIRVSHRVQAMPDWVLDFVLAHELVHLVEPNHGRRFQDLLACYPLCERAQGYLEGFATASGTTTGLCPDGIDDSDRSDKATADADWPG